MKFCSICGHSVSLAIPAGDNRERYVCDASECGAIHYQNPRIITGCLPVCGNKVLLCKRAIEPRLGLWTLPAGFMENGETTEEGAIRESWEEARANLAVDQLYTLFDLPHINQVYFFFKAQLLDHNYSAGEESLEVKLFAEHEIPWNEIAFPVITHTLRYYFDDYRENRYQQRALVIRPQEYQTPKQ